MLIVDCSVALKWVLLEEGRDDALDLIGEPLAAPDFLKLECANVLAMRVRRGLLTAERAQASLREIEALSAIDFRAGLPYVEDAQRLALELNQTAYDCLYLAMAMQEGGVVVTSDERFATGVLSSQTYRSFLRRL